MTEIAKTVEELAQKNDLTEQDLLSLGLGIVPAVNNYEAFEYNKTKQIPTVDGSLLEYRYDHIHEWLNNDIYDRTINLPQEEKDRYFQMIVDYGDILAKLLNDDNNVIFEYARGAEHPWAKLEKHAKKANIVLDYDKPKQLIKEFEEWKARKGF